MHRIVATPTTPTPKIDNNRLFCSNSERLKLNSIAISSRTKSKERINADNAILIDEHLYDIGLGFKANDFMHNLTVLTV